MDEVINYKKAAGHPHFYVGMVFTILILEFFYNLLDEEMEYQLNAILSISLGFIFDLMCRISYYNALGIFTRPILLVFPI